jgi:ribosome production factor 2
MSAAQMALKKPYAISFSKKNTIRPFEDASSFEFWAQKNDASMFMVGQSTKKRPNGLVIARMFDSKVLDMCELGVDKFVSMSEFKASFFSPFRSGAIQKTNILCCDRHQNQRLGISL